MYSRYIQSVAFNAENKYTARLYMLITSARGFEKESEGIFHWYVGYNELRRMLGCDTKEGNTWRRSTQLLYKHFKSNILKTAEEELKALADAGKSDCWFEYVELPEERKGDPERFDFIVHLSEMGKLENSHTRELQQLNHITDFMQKEWGMTEHECSKILSALPSDCSTLFDTRMHELATDMQKKGNQIKNRKLYAKKSLTEAIKEIKAQASPSASTTTVLGGSATEPSPSPASGGFPLRPRHQRPMAQDRWQQELPDLPLTSQGGAQRKQSARHRPPHRSQGMDAAIRTTQTRRERSDS